MKLFHLTPIVLFISALTSQAVKADALCQYPWLFERDHWELAIGEKELQGDQLAHPNQDEYHLTGNASLTLHDKKLTAAQVHYFQEADVAYAFNEVQLQNQQYLIQAEELQHDETNLVTHLYDLNYQLIDNQAWGKADSAVITQENEQVSLRNLHYTGCPIGKEDWWLSFDKLVIDEQTKLATGDNIVLRFHDVPVFYFPKFQFTTADRASGLLMPSFMTQRTTIGSQEKTETYVKIPYYFNIAPNMDDTLTLIQVDDRGTALDNEFRYWLPWQKGELTTTLFPDDETGDNRYRILWKANQTMPNRWNLSWHWHDTSDPNFYRDTNLVDFTLRNTLYLDRSITLNKAWENQRVEMQLLDFKPMLHTSHYYSALPKIQHQWQHAPIDSPLFAQVDSEFSHFLAPFARTSLPTGNRFHLAPTVGFDVWKPYGFLRAQTQLHMTHYGLEDNGKDNSITRVLPTTSLDVGLNFEKPLSLFDQSYIHTIEPRLKYLHTPKVKQSHIPLFDTMGRNFDYLQLFSDNRFTGLDRIGDANQLTTGMFSRLFRQDTGKELLELGVGQIIYFEDRHVQLQPQTEPSRGEFSDLMLTAALSYERWRASLTQQIDRDSKKITQEDVGLQYVSNDHNQFVIRHRKRKLIDSTREDEQTTLGAQLRFSPSFSSLHYVNYNHTEQQFRSSIHALQYDSCCWAAQLVWEQGEYLDRNRNNQLQTRTDNAIHLAFIFKGLTTYGSRIDDRINSRLYFE